MQTNLQYYLELVINSSFPLNDYTIDTAKQKYELLCANDCSPNSNIALETVKYFHESIWRCNIANHSAPVEAWQDQNIMTKVIANRLKYKGSELTLRDIRAGLSIAKFAPKVSVFRPATAKYLIKKYLNDFDTIFDPCAGFSGRLLGACSLNKKYIGQDINSTTVKECNNLIARLNLTTADVKLVDSLYDTGNYDCLFTCPPYGAKEKWHQDIEILSADEWIDTCLANFKCKAYLFVVDNTTKYSNYIVEELKNRSPIGNSVEKVILIDLR